MRFGDEGAFDETSTEALSGYAADLGLTEHIRTARTELADLIQRDRPTLRTLRLRLGLSQQDLAIKLGTSQSRISNIESRNDGMGFAFAHKMADALDVTLDVLYEATEGALSG